MTGPMFLPDSLGAPSRVSIAADGSPANNASADAAVSADGRYVLFDSLASNLVAGDSNANWDVFERDLQTGTTTRVSTTASGAQASGASEHARFGASNMQIVFDSNAPDLVTHGDANGRFDVFVKDLGTGAVTLASKSSAGIVGNDDSVNGIVSPDSKSVAFESLASNLIGADINHARDIYVTNLATGIVTRVSTDANGGEANGQSADAAWSPDGSKIVFESNASNLVAGDTNRDYDIFVKDLGTGAVTRVSTAADGTQSNGHSFHAQFTADGGSVIFESTATDLVPGGTTGGREIFEKNLITGAVTLLSTGANGPANGSSYDAVQGGASTAYESVGNNLTPGSANAHRDVFLGNGAGLTVRALGVGGVDPNADVLHPALSVDGATLVYQSTASNLAAGDSNGMSDIFVQHLNPSTAMGAVTENGAPATGTLLFSDGDPAATHTVSVVAPSGALGELTATMIHDSTSVATGQIGWSFGSGGFAQLAAGETATETFQVNVTDGAGHVASKPVTLTLTGANDPPVANPDHVELAVNTTTADLAPTLLANDTDVDHGDKIAISGVDTTGTLGTVSVDPVTGAIAYTADPWTFNTLQVGQTATDHFAYTIHDLVGTTSTTQVTVTVDGIATPPGASGPQSLIAAPGGSTLTGGTGPDTLIGGPGDDVLIGGHGAATLIGGGGNNAYLVNNPADTVVSSPGSHDTVVSTIDYLLPANVSDLTLVGGNLNGTGNALPNHIVGTDGNNVLNGAVGGSDILEGGRGNDTLIVNNPGDTVIEQAGAGVDAVQTALPSYTLPANVAQLVYTGTGDFTGTGNDLGNVIQGGPGNDTLTGGAGNDRIYGARGNNIINGEGGTDILWGGPGANIFVEARGQAQGDIICDFNTRGTGDRIELTGWGAGTTLTATGSGQFAIHDGVDGHVEVMTIIGNVHPADVMFG